MATVARGGSRESPAERLAELVVLGGMAALALAAVLPLIAIAMPVLGALYALRRRNRVVCVGASALCLLPTLVAVLVALVTRGTQPLDVALGYVDVQLEAAVGLAAQWAGRGAFDWRSYGQTVWPYALCGGAALGAVGALVLCGTGYGRGARHDLRPVSADELGKQTGEAEPQPVDGFTARGRLTALTALPKQGKTFAWFGLLKARQTGGQWFGREVLPGKTLVMTEEDRGTFAGKVRRFGITGAALVSVHAPETADSRFGQEAWPALIGDAARLARRKGCDTLTMDTLTTWAPWAFRGPESMSFALRTLKAACGAHKLAGVVILHNRKQQTDLGAVVDMLGTIAGSAAYDVIAGFKREKDNGECTLHVDGRLGEWACTAVLQHGRYVPVDHRPGDEQQGTFPAPAPALPSHLRGTLARLQAAGETTADALLAAEGGSKRALLGRLGELKTLGLVDRSGRGVAGDPYVWAAVDLERETAQPAPPNVTDDPAYVAYLKSPEWLIKRAQIMHRASGHCERCGPGGAPPAEVHHLTYERVYDERPGDLIALCAPCHRRAHPPA
jgi:hypothetical protein